MRSAAGDNRAHHLGAVTFHACPVKSLSAARSVDPTRICELSAACLGNQMEIPPEALETDDSIMFSDLRKELTCSLASLAHD